MKSAARLSRRRFLRQTGGLCGAGLLPIRAGTLGAWAAEATAEPGRTPADRVAVLSEHLAVHTGPVNVGIIRDGGSALLIDIGDGSVAECLPGLRIDRIDRILFTHHHRDQACGLGRVAPAASARIGVPAGEREWFERPDAYWNDVGRLTHEYNFHPHRLMLTKPVRVDAEMGPETILDWGPARIRVLPTPGHTDGSVSYLVEIDGHKVLFTGDVLYDEGRIGNLHAMQKGFRRGGTAIRDYHGFMGSCDELLGSLDRIKTAAAEVLVPSHGRIVNEPARAVDLLANRLNACYDRYVQISALRHYFPALFSEFAGKPGHMAFDKGIAPPDFLIHIGTSRILVSRDGPGLMMDCGGPKVIAEVGKLVESGRLAGIEGLWVTHYHDDHTDAVAAGREAFACPVIADASVAEIITRPTAWRLPCVSRNATRVDRVTAHGETWAWHEYTLTAYHFPGQTLHHGALLVEGRGAKMLFAGDSFTPAGIDDYCSYNRNWLGEGVGFDRCLSLIETVRPTHIFNCHVDNAFTFAPEQLRHMRDNLARREREFGELVAWDHPNYATDESWAHCRPYEQQASAGQRIELLVKVRNHSTEPRELKARLVLPGDWAVGAGLANRAVVEWKSTTIAPKADGAVTFTLDVPPGLSPGRYVVTADLDYHSRILPQFTEAIVVVS